MAVAPRVGLYNFSKGVLSKELWGRVDIAPYNAAVRQGSNVLVLKYGGLTKRPGTRLVYEIKDGPKRLIPFEGAYEASYAMLMGQANMRLAALGGMVLEQALTVQAVSTTNPAIITAAFHGFSTGDEVFFTGVQGAVGLNGRAFSVTVLSANTFSIPVDGAAIGVLTGDEGGVVRSSAPAPAPAPPPVPDPTPPAEPPVVGGGGWGGGGYNPYEQIP